VAGAARLRRSIAGARATAARSRSGSRPLAEIEALGSLAGYAYEHPDDVFPEIVEDGPLLEATALGTR